MRYSGRPKYHSSSRQGAMDLARNGKPCVARFDAEPCGESHQVRRSNSITASVGDVYTFALGLPEARRSIWLAPVLSWLVENRTS